MKPLQPGSTIPKFVLPDQNGILIQSSFFLRKRILLYFYPKSMTPGCTIQACKLRDNIHIFQYLKIAIIGISTDKPEKLLIFSEKEKLNFLLLSDETHHVANQFKVWGEKKFIGKIYHGIHRITFLINQKSIIEQVFDNFQPNNHHQIILNYLNKIKKNI